MNLNSEEQDAYRRARDLSDGDLAMALLMGDMRITGTWPAGRAPAEGDELERMNARIRGLKRAERERHGE